MENFPKIDLFPRVTRAAEFIKSIFRHLPESGYPGDHVRGGGPALDKELYDQPVLPMYYHDVTSENRWDSEGNYFEG